MSYFRTFFIISLVSISGLLVALLVKTCNKELHVAPDIEMIQNCETMITSVHIFNPDSLKSMNVKYDVFVDMNDNAMLDSTDPFVYGEPKKVLGPQAEDQGIAIGQMKYKGYSFIVRAVTDDVIAYYASIPCDVNLAERDSTPTK